MNSTTTEPVAPALRGLRIRMGWALTARSSSGSGADARAGCAAVAGGGLLLVPGAAAAAAAWRSASGRGAAFLLGRRLLLLAASAARQLTPLRAWRRCSFLLAALVFPALLWSRSVWRLASCSAVSCCWAMRELERGGSLPAMAGLQATQRRMLAVGLRSRRPAAWLRRNPRGRWPARWRSPSSASGRSTRSTRWASAGCLSRNAR